MSKFMYLKSRSGKIQNFAEFSKDLRKIATPEKMRFRAIRKLLLKEAQPIVTAARKAAYEDSKRPAKGGMRQRGKTGTAFYNLYRSINKFANKGVVKAYVVVGLREEKKSPAGAYYAKMVLAGTGPKDFVTVGKRIAPKDFFTKAVQNTNALERADIMMRRHIDKVLKKI